MALFKDIGRGITKLGRKAASGYKSYSDAALDYTGYLPRTAITGLKDIVTGAYGEASPTPFAPASPSVQVPKTPSWRGSLDPREYSASQMLTSNPPAASPFLPPPLLRAPTTSAVMPAPSSIQKAPMDYSKEPLMAAGRRDASGILYDGLPSTQSRVAAGDAEARPYAYQQPAVTNAFTMGAPADDARSRLMAATAVKKFNAAEELLKSNKTPEAEAAYKAAQEDANKWGKWAALTPGARQQLLMSGEREANAGQGREQFATLRNEMDTPGAAELLSYAAKLNAGQVDASGNPISKYGSGQVVGYVPKGTQTAQTGINNYLKEYDPYDKRVDWATQPNEAGLTDEEIIKRSGGSASAAAKLADLRAMQRRQYLSDRGMTAASLLTGK